jgi:predicted nucleotidyltransferase component of viral defense system
VSRKRPVNVAASVRQRLLDLARRQGLRMQDVLVRFATERLLYRLAQSPHRDAYVLKGAMLFTVWTGILPRATKDADLLGFGDPSPDRMVRIFRELAADARSEDGLVFDAASVLVRAIREDSEYGGQRVTLAAELDGARLRVQVDVGFGDAVEPGPVEVVLPTLLDLPAARLRAYPVEVSVAEKFEALVRLGLVNGRLKDYFDLWYIATRLPPDRRPLAGAVRATFDRRGTAIPPGVPPGLTDAFADDDRRRQWEVFLDRVLAPGAERPSLNAVIAAVREFLMPVAVLARSRRLD